MKTWKSSFVVFVSNGMLFCTEVWYFEKTNKGTWCMSCQIWWHPSCACEVFNCFVHYMHGKCLTVLYMYLKHCPNLYFSSLLGNSVLFYTEITYFERLTNACDEWLWTVRYCVIHHMQNCHFIYTSVKPIVKIFIFGLC